MAGLEVGEKVTHGEAVNVNCTDNYEVIFRFFYSEKLLR